MTTAYLGLGTNLGDREANLRQAVRLIESPETMVTKISSLYETEPIGYLEQPWFLNIAVAVETELGPVPLLEACRRVEQALGRERTIANGPRTIDVDVLLYGGLVLASERLTIPHPRYLERRFVLAPLVEIAPAQTDPVSGERLVDVLSRLTGQAVRNRGGLSGL